MIKGISLLTVTAKTRICLVWLLIGIALPGLAVEHPEISNIFPDFPSSSPSLITGEGFDPASTQIWTWEPKGGETTVTESDRRQPVD